MKQNAEVFKSVDEAARFVGLSRPTFTLRVLPLIPHQRAGSRYLISRKALTAWLEGNEEGDK